jgi:hypothetical protein
MCANGQNIGANHLGYKCTNSLEGEEAVVPFEGAVEEGSKDLAELKRKLENNFGVKLFILLFPII